MKRALSPSIAVKHNDQKYKKNVVFGIDELIGAFRYSTGYCLDTDEDGDKILWKYGPRKNGKNS